jgi:hypothetical protein
VGFQLIGPAFSENRILQAAHALEGAIGFETTPAFQDSGAGALGETRTHAPVTFSPEDAQS